MARIDYFEEWIAVPKRWSQRNTKECRGVYVRSVQLRNWPFFRLVQNLGPAQRDVVVFLASG